MSHLTLYRKYRSQTFGDLVGQSHVVRSLQNALARNKQVQAYLFTGPRGTGKTSTARLLAKALNCEAGPSPEPCNVCGACVSITEGSCFDVIELDAASDSGVDDVREKIVEVAEYPPGFCRYRIIILDEVHDLSSKAFDALLKTIEEPPAHLVFILATTEFQKVPPTIRSRCQKFEFHRGSVQEISARIQFVADAENIAIEPGAVSTLARMADGGFRDALTLLEQASLLADGPITVEQIFDQLGLVDETSIDALLVAVRQCDLQRIIESLDGMAQSGRDPRTIVESMMFRLSDLTRSILGNQLSVDGIGAAAAHETGTQMGLDAMSRLRARLARTHQGIRDVSLPRIWLEAELIGIAKELSAPEKQAQPVVKPTKSESPSQPVPIARSKPPFVAPEPQQVQAERAESTNEDAPKIEVREPQQEETGTEPTDTAIRVWKKTVRHMFGPGGSVNLANKLYATRVKSFDGEKLVVAFERNVDLNSVVGGPKGPQKRQMIGAMLELAGGQGWSIEYVFESTGAVVVEESAAVELPVEGKRLHELAKEVFPGT